jgi:hypothetical protein
MRAIGGDTKYSSPDRDSQQIAIFIDPTSAPIIAVS